DSPFELEAFSDSDYGGANLDRKSTTEYVASANYYGQVLWIQNQMMDYGFNFMNTKIHIDNKSTISVIKNHLAHSRTKHIEIQFHFIRDCYEKRLIEVIKIHTCSNVANLLTKGFDVTRFNFLVVSIGMIDGLEKDLQQTKKTYSTALTKLVLRVKKLEYKLKSGKARRKAKIVLSDEEEVHEKPSDETEVLVQEETPTEIIEEHRSGEKCEMEISTANIQVSTASPPKVSIAVPHVYTRRSAKDIGKAIMEDHATPKKVKKRTQVQLKREARALQEEEEKRLNLEAARELQRQLDQRQENKLVLIAQARRNMITYLKNQGGYKESYFKRMNYNDIRPIFERVWDHVNTFIPIRSKVKKDSSKPSKRETSKIVKEEKVEEEDVNPEPVLIEKKVVGIRKKTLTRRGASDKQGQDSSKRQKKEKEIVDYEEEKDELRMWLTVVPDEEEFVDPEILHTKFPIVDWESQSLYSMNVYKIIRTYRNLMLWGDLKILVDPE
ncbi:hypothetical protein Tco_0931593, partial [Tanacetum coccineum]